MKLFDNSTEPFYLDDSKPMSFADLNYQALDDWGIRQDDKEASVIRKFHGAAYYKQFERVKQGVAAKIPHVIDAGATLLNSAAEGGSVEITRYLIQDLKFNPAFCNPKKGMRYNALHAACATGQFEVVKFLVTESPKPLSINIQEPNYKLSPLQTAISQNRFACAAKIIAELNPDLQQTDRFSRTPLATLLSCYVNAEFDKLKNDQDKLTQLQNLCVQLLKSENAFNRVTPDAHPAYLVFNTCELALEIPSGTELTDRIEVDKLITTIMVVAPELAVTLLKQAQEKSEGTLESAYINSYNRCVLKIRQETDKALKVLM